MTRPVTHTTKRAGTYLGYLTDKCRCAGCTEAWRLYQAKRARDIAYRGRTVATRVTPDTAAHHIHNLRARGIGARTVAIATGVSASTIDQIANGRRVWISAQTERAILGYTTPAPTLLAERSRIEATGTHRRIRALQAIGWALTDLAERLGCTGANIGETLRSDRVRAKTARNIAALYDELWNTPAPRGQKRTKTLNLARLHGWVPPLAWDDDTIDDPDAQPNIGEIGIRPGGGRPIAELVEDIEWLLHHDSAITAGQLAERLGFADRSAIQNALARHGYRDLLDRLNRNAGIAA